MKIHRWAVLTLGAITLGMVLTPHGLRAQSDAKYDVSLVSLQVEETKANGSAWDVGGGKPDLMLIVSNERSGKTVITKVAKDSYSVAFDPKARALEVEDGDILDILVLDEDILDSDIVGISRKAITGGVLANKELDLSFGRVRQLRLAFGPHTSSSAQ